MILITPEAKKDFRAFMIANHRDVSPGDVMSVLASKNPEDLPMILSPWIVRNPTTLSAVIAQFGVKALPTEYKDDYVSETGGRIREISGLHGYIGERINSLCLRYHCYHSKKYLDDIKNLTDSLAILDSWNVSTSPKHTIMHEESGRIAEIDYSAKLKKVLAHPESAFSVFYKDDLLRETSLFLHNNLQIGKDILPALSEVLFRDRNVCWSLLEYIRTGSLRKLRQAEPEIFASLKAGNYNIVNAHLVWEKKIRPEGTKCPELPIDLSGRLCLPKRQRPMQGSVAAENLFRSVVCSIRLKEAKKIGMIFISTGHKKPNDFEDGICCASIQELRNTIDKIMVPGRENERLEYRVAIYSTGASEHQEKPYVLIYMQDIPNPEISFMAFNGAVTKRDWEYHKESMNRVISMMNRESNTKYTIKSTRKIPDGVVYTFVNDDQRQTIIMPEEMAKV